MRQFKIFVVFILISVKFFSLYGQQGQWTWMKGDTTFDSPGHYGIQGVADPANNPPALFGSNGWVDHHGNFWLFGGIQGWDTYNDLWKYDVSTNMWIWVNGPGIPNQPGIYGELGAPADSNLPRYRGEFTTWVDLYGDLWLFGGADGMGHLNDLWRYQISSNKWTWMKGPTHNINYVHYGIITISAPENNPPYRAGACGGWVDNVGDLWMFGGKNSWGLNDVWKFNISSNNWTWMAGTDTIQVPPEYGDQNVSSAMNTPGARGFYSHWKDSDGNFWLFGGENTNLGFIYDDLWMFNPLTLQWTWVSGSNIANDTGSCTEGLCLPLVNNFPSSRALSTNGWKGVCDYFYLFGGSSGWQHFRSDLWCYNISSKEWTFVNGTLNINDPGFHGTMGAPGTANQPRSKSGGCSWTDFSGNFWVFGGIDSSGFFNDFHTNELWKYKPDTLCPAGQETSTFSISPDTTICAGDTIMIKAGGGTYYNWSPATNISNPLIPNPFVNPDTSTVYRVKIYANKCYSELYVNIRVNTDSLFSVSPQDTLVCKGDSIKLHTSGGDSVHWQPDIFLSSNNIHNPLAIPDTNITYTVSLSNSCFNKTFIVILEVYPGPTKGIINTDTLICAGQSVLLQAVGGIQYLWNFGQSGNSIIVTPQQQTNYIVTITDIYGCKESDSVVVDVNPSPLIQVSATEPTICLGSSILLTASGATYYKWSSVGWISDTTGGSIAITPTQSSNYSVIGTDLNNCSESASIYIEVLNCNITIPNVFTPNGDGINDYFQVKYEGILDYGVQIFNRWGIKLFESHDIESQWNGKYNEQEVSTGTYYYVVWVGDKECKGTVTLLR